MKDYLKFLQKLPRPVRERLIFTIEQIAHGNLEKLDIKPLHGYPDFYRCRLGKIRIIFIKRADGNFIYDVGFRGDIYRDL